MQTLQHDAEAVLAELTRHAIALIAPGVRRAMGIAGGPGVGKSTLAAELLRRVNSIEPGVAAYVPMDGFHMRHAKLVALGIETLKGMPHTFDAKDFVEFLRHAKSSLGSTTFGPGYSRTTEDVVEKAVVVDAAAMLLIVEGNYLLLNDEPWTDIRPLLDLSVFIDVPRALVRERLIKRHAQGRLFTDAYILRHVDEVDLRNYDLVKQRGSQADLSILIAEDS